MTTASIPVDLFNAGQVFACLGLMEIAEVLFGQSQAAFDWSDPRQCRFLLGVEADADPIAAGLEFLAQAQVSAMAPPASELDTEKWKVPCRAGPAAGPFPIPPPSTPATLPAVLSGPTCSITISSWGEGRIPGALGSGRDNVKFWAGSGGYPGVALLRDALDAIRSKIPEATSDPFSVSAPQSSSFRLDWRRDYIPIDIGFSLNEHASIQPRGYPLVEALAVIGLCHARPRRIHKLKYQYAVVGRASAAATHEPMFPASFVRAALGAARLPLATRTFTMHLNWPGQENQARCITTVLEEAY